MATGGLVWLSPHPTVLCVLLVGLLGMALWRWHDQRDLAGLAVGAVFGNLTELASDLAGLWIHHTPQILGVVPSYILLCYPLLGLAFPRLVDALVGRERPAAEGRGTTLAHACGLGVVLVSLPCLGAGQAIVQWWLCAICLALILGRFHARHDLVGGLVGVAMSWGWELPCTMAGIWLFPQAQLFGHLPLWLPLAYAGFFVLLGRMASGLTMHQEFVRPGTLAPEESAV